MVRVTNAHSKLLGWQALSVMDMFAMMFGYICLLMLSGFLIFVGVDMLSYNMSFGDAVHNMFLKMWEG